MPGAKLHFVPHEQILDHGGFRAIFWDPLRDLQTAVEDLVVMLEKLKAHHNFSQGATCQLMVLCVCNAVHDLLLQHGFYTSVSSAAGATACIAVVVQTGSGFLSGGRLKVLHLMTKKIAQGLQWP